MALNEQTQQNIDSVVDDMLKELQTQVRERAEQLSAAIPAEYCVDPETGSMKTQYVKKEECVADGYEWQVNLEKKRDIARNNEKLTEVCSDPRYTTEKDCIAAGKIWAPDLSHKSANKYLDQVQSWIKGHAANMESSPTLYLAPRTSLIKVPYGIIRKAAEEHKSIIVVPYSSANPLRLDKRIFKEDIDSIKHSKDDALYLGFTKASLAAIASGSTVPSSGNKIAPFTTLIKEISYDDTAGELTISLYNRPGSGSAFGPEKWSNYVNIELTDDSKDSLEVELGRYADPSNPSAGGVVENFLNGWKYEVSHALSGQMKDTARDFLNVIDEEVLSRQFICCIFFEILNNSTDDLSFATEVKGTPTELYHKLLENKAEVQKFLDENRDFLLNIKAVLEILLVHFSEHRVDIVIPSVGLNISRMLLNAIYMTIIIVAEEAQTEALKRQMKWLEKQKEKTLKAIEESKDTEAGRIAAGVAKCVPLEKLIVVIINALFGKDGMLKYITGIVTRMKRALALKGEEVKEGMNISASAKSSLKYVPLIKGTLDIVNLLLSLNLDAWDLCQSYGDRYLDDESAGETGTQGTGETGDVGSGGTGDYDVSSSPGGADSNIPIQPGLQEGSQNLGINTGGANAMTTGGTIDITNSTIDPLKLLLLKDNQEITKVFAQYLEFSPQEAADLVQQAKTGECSKNLDLADAEALKALFNQAGVNI